MLLAQEVGVDADRRQLRRLRRRRRAAGRHPRRRRRVRRDRRRRGDRVGRGRRRPHPRRHQRGGRSRASTPRPSSDEGVDLVFTNWRGIVAPPGISDDEHAEVRRRGHRDARQRAWKQALEDNGWTDAFITGDEFSDVPHRGERPGRGRHERAGPGVSSAAPGGTREQGRSEYGVALFLGALGVLVIVRRCCCPRAGSPVARSAPAAIPMRRRRPARDRRRLPRRGHLPRRSRRAGGRRGRRARRRQRLAHGPDAGGGVRRQRPADRAPRLAVLRRDPVLGRRLRPRQPALHP